MFLWRTDWEAEATITARSRPGTLSVGDGGGFLAFQPGPFRRGMVAHHGGKISHVHLVFPYVKFFFCFCPVCLLFQPRFPRYTVDQVEEGEEAIIPSIASLQLRKERKGMRRETYDLYDEETKCSWGREGRGERKKIPCKVGKGLHRQGGCTREVWLVLTTYTRKMLRHAQIYS